MSQSENKPIYISGPIPNIKDAFELMFALHGEYGLVDLMLTKDPAPIQVILPEATLDPESITAIQDWARAFLVGLNWQRRL
jgi:hypothetical protein